MRTPPYFLAFAAAALALPACRTLRPIDSSDSGRRHRDAAAYLAHPIVVGQLFVHADFPLPEDHRLLRELAAERETILDRLQLPPSETPIHVHLFAEESGYRQHVSREYPGFPERRAIFVEEPGSLTVYAHWNDAIAEDLRHEIAHGYLHASLPDVPLWLDEGLAEYFEVSRGRNGVNKLHVDYLVGQLAVGGWQPDLPRLERLATADQMTQLDYAEAWLWVHFLLDSTDFKTTLLADYLTDIRATGDKPATPLSQRVNQLLASPTSSLIAHLKSIPR